MKDLLGKIGQFCENHVEKIVLGLVGIVCVWLFFTRVIFSPNVLTVERNGKGLTPGQIDRYVYEKKAQPLQSKLRENKKGTGKPYPRRFDGAVGAKDAIVAGIIDRPLPKGFAGLFDSPLSFLKVDLGNMVTPGYVSTTRVAADRKYRLPLVPDVTDVGISYLRAAAYVPRQEVTPQNTYDKVPTEPNDIDLVTVEGKFDVAELYRRYQASFAGVDVQKEEWRDPCLAKPVFAAVQLERQELAEDGSWGKWQPVPRTRVEANRELFRPIDRLADLPVGGLGVRLVQFNNEFTTTQLLQPESYSIASAEEEWFPPSYYTKYKDLQRKVDAEKRRDDKEKDRKTDRTGTDTRGNMMNRGGQGGMYGGGQTPGSMRGAPGAGRGRNTPGGMQGGDMMYNQGGRGGRGGRGGQGMPGDMMYNQGGRTKAGKRGAASDQYGPGGDMMYGMPGEMGPGMRRKGSTNEVYWQFGEDMIGYREDLSKRTKPVLFWVFDDTAEPGKTYQYRVRLGVFNPVAGTGQLVERDIKKNDQVILWSPYSPVTKPVEIPKRIYLFAKDVQDKTKTATVEVARYALGYWRSESFQVQIGEAIGKQMEPKKEDDKKTKDRMRMAGGYGYGYPPGPGSDRITGMPPGGPVGPGGMPGYMPTGPEQQNVPKVIDYRTGKILVDLVQVNDWGNAPNLRPRMYNDMLLTGDGMNIEHMPVNMTNWPKDLATAYQYVQAEKRREPQPFRAFNKSGTRGRGRGGMPGMEGGYEDMGMYDEMGGDYGGGYEGMGGMGPY